MSFSGYQNAVNAQNNGVQSLTNGVWTGSVLTNHDVLVGGASNAITSVSPSTAGLVLTSNGVAADPSFQAVSASGAVTTVTGDTGGAEVPLAGNFNILGSGSITTAGSANTETVQLTGLTNHSVLVGAGTTTITKVAPSTAGFVLTSNGAAADPSFQTVTASGAITSITGDTGGPEVPSSGNFNVLGTGSITVVGSANTETVQVTGLTNHSVLVGAGTATITKVAPSATLGIPLVSNGAAADPSFTTAVVAGGGTGATSFTAFAPVCGGTTTTGTLQSASTGQSTSGFVLTSTGASSLPTFQTVSASGAVTTITGNSGGAESPSAGNFNIVGTGSITIAGTANTETVQLTGLTNHNVLVGAGTATITNVAPSTAGFVLTSNGASSDPSFQTVSASGASTSFNGNTGTATPSSGVITVTTGASNANGTAIFTGSGSTLTQTFTDANHNTGLGTSVLNGSLSGTENTAFGGSALHAVTSGGGNTAVGYQALQSITTGSQCTAIGDLSLASNTASFNTAVGYNALMTNTSGANCVAIGTQALAASNANNNIAIGFLSLNTNSSGTNNTAVGNASLQTNSTGVNNVAIGSNALNAATNSSNVAVGTLSGQAISSGADNTAIGNASLDNLLTGSNNTSVGSGAGAGYTGSEVSNISINNGGTAGESHVLRIGSGTGTGTQQLNKAFISGIRGITTVNNDAVAVLVDSANQLGTVSSSLRYKKEVDTISTDECAKIQELRPVKFKYKDNADSPKFDYGLIAEEAAKQFPDLIVYKDEQPETIQYHKFYGILIAEIQRLHKRIVSLEAKLGV